MTNSVDEEQLRERNKLLEDTLRDARSELRRGVEEVADDMRRSAILESIDYVIVAVDLRRDELRKAIMSQQVGTERDAAMRKIPDERIAEIFEDALLAQGFVVKAKS